jgi:cell division protease FtsH
MIFGYDKVTTGASSDIKMATDIARRMVTEWGMSDKLGPLHYGSDQGEVFLGYSMGQSKGMSEGTAAIVDDEVRKIVDVAYIRATQLLKQFIDELHIVAKALLEYEMLSGDEIKALLRGEKIIREDYNEDEDARPKSSVPTTGGGGGFGPGEIPQGA